jgi:hypothetical protein
MSLANLLHYQTIKLINNTPVTARHAHTATLTKTHFVLLPQLSRPDGTAEAPCTDTVQLLVGTRASKSDTLLSC